MSLRRNAPDSQALAIAREMQKQLQPAEVILLGSRAAGDHRPDSDVDLMAVVLDDNGNGRPTRFSGNSWRGSTRSRW